MNEMITRSFEIRSVDTEARTIEGIAAPYNQTINAGEYNERFEPGVFGELGDVKLFLNHDHLDSRSNTPIGKVTHGEDTEDGYVIRAHISQTVKGEEVYQLLKDGVLKAFSVGFLPIEDRNDEDNTVVRTKAELREVSVVAYPAYSGAQVLAVRDDSTKKINEKGDINNMSENENIDFATVADLTEVRDAVDEMDRKFAVMGEKPEMVEPKYRSMGQALKARVEGDSDAVAEYRTYAGATTAKSHESIGWLGGALTVINRGRPVVNLFNSDTLPNSGTIVTYPYISATTGAVASQVLEGDDLTQIDVTVSTATAPVRLFGVKSDLSLQVIQRSDVAYLDAVLRTQLASYAKVTNDYARTVMVAATPQTGTSFTLSSATATDFLKATAKGVDLIYNNANGLQADFILVSQDVWEGMLGTASNGFAFDVNNSNGLTIGRASVPTIQGSLAGLPVVVDSGLSVKSFYVASGDAMTTWENSAAPVRLDLENPSNLTHVYSIYGYMAAGVQNANGIVKSTVA